MQRILPLIFIAFTDALLLIGRFSTVLKKTILRSFSDDLVTFGECSAKPSLKTCHNEQLLMIFSHEHRDEDVTT